MCLKRRVVKKYHVLCVKMRTIDICIAFNTLHLDGEIEIKNSYVCYQEDTYE